MIAASVTALGLDVRDGKILLDQSLVELGQLVVGEIGDDADFLPGPPLDPGGHVELAHGNDVDTAGPVVLGDGLGAQETGLLRTPVSTIHCDEYVSEADLSRIPVELDGAVRPEVRFQQRPVRFQDCYGSTTIVVGTLGSDASTTRKREPRRRDPYQGREGMVSCWCFLVA